jgi:hypothetical protein
MSKKASEIIQELEAVVAELKKLDPEEIVNQYHVLMCGQTNQIIARHMFVTGNTDQNCYKRVQTYSEACLQQIDDEIDIVYISQSELKPFLEPVEPPEMGEYH